RSGSEYVSFEVEGGRLTADIVCQRRGSEVSGDGRGVSVQRSAGSIHGEFKIADGSGDDINTHQCCFTDGGSKCAPGASVFTILRICGCGECVAEAQI
ncbi:MAG: hypothetical protein ACKPHU_13085, partial [Planctomycetaceae bacterium]